METKLLSNMAVVRNKKTDDLYKFNGGNSFTNIRTGVTGEVSDEAARKTFAINLEATQLLSEYPLILDLIKTLNLKIDK